MEFEGMSQAGATTGRATSNGASTVRLESESSSASSASSCGGNGVAAPTGNAALVNRIVKLRRDSKKRLSMQTDCSKTR